MTAVCCNQCFQSIAKGNTTAARLWLDSCAFFVKLQGIYLLRETRIPDTIKYMKYLEELGYITTADGLEGVKVRVNGYDVMEANNDFLETFCLQRQEHQSEWV